jgi:DNA-binding TFAR19-related protein (PDSD5 family)
VKPSPTKIDKLARDIASAAAGTELNAAKRARLAQHLERAVNDLMNAGEMTALAGEVEQNLRDAGVGRVPAAIVSNDLKSIIAEIQQGRSK